MGSGIGDQGSRRNASLLAGRHPRIAEGFWPRAKQAQSQKPKARERQYLGRLGST